MRILLVIKCKPCTFPHVPYCTLVFTLSNTRQFKRQWKSLGAQCPQCAPHAPLHYSLTLSNPRTQMILLIKGLIGLTRHSHRAVQNGRGSSNLHLVYWCFQKGPAVPTFTCVPPGHPSTACIFFGDITL